MGQIYVFYHAVDKTQIFILIKINLVKKQKNPAGKTGFYFLAANEFAVFDALRRQVSAKALLLVFFIFGKASFKEINF